MGNSHRHHQQHHYPQPNAYGSSPNSYGYPPAVAYAYPQQEPRRQGSGCCLPLAVCLGLCCGCCMGDCLDDCECC